MTMPRCHCERSEAIWRSNSGGRGGLLPENCRLGVLMSSSFSPEAFHDRTVNVLNTNSNFVNNSEYQSGFSLLFWSFHPRDLRISAAFYGFSDCLFRDYQVDQPGRRSTTWLPVALLADIASGRGLACVDRRGMTRGAAPRRRVV